MGTTDTTKDLTVIFTKSPLRSNVCFCTFRFRGGPGDEAAHQAAAEQEFLGEAGGGRSCRVSVGG